LMVLALAGLSTMTRFMALYRGKRGANVVAAGAEVNRRVEDGQPFRVT